MRILNVIASTDPAHGGPIEWVRQFGLAAQAQGHTIEVLSMDAPGAACVAAFPLTVHAVGSRLRGFYSPPLVPWLRRYAHAYDCVIAHGLWRYPSFGTWRALHNGSVPYFVYTHGMLDPWFRARYPIKHAAKMAYWPFTDYRALRDARGVIFTCEQERLKAATAIRPYRGREMVATLGIEPPPGDPTAQRGLFHTRYPETLGKRIALFLGRIHPKKGCDLLIDSFPALVRNDPSFHLVMAGPDPSGWRRELQEMAQRRGVAERITWADMVTGDLKWGAYRAAEVFVLPSHQENFGITVVEALACGVPVLISEGVDIFDEIRVDGAGLTAPATPAGTADLLRRWTDLSGEDREGMRESAVKCFRTRFEVRTATEKLLGMLESAIAERIPP